MKPHLWRYRDYWACGPRRAGIAFCVIGETIAEAFRSWVYRTYNPGPH